MQTRTELRYATVALEFGAGNAWINPDNALGLPAVPDALVEPPGTTKNLGLYGLGFTIPDAGTPQGLQVRALRWRVIQTPCSCQDAVVRFCQAQTLIGNDKADTATNWPGIPKWKRYPDPNGTDLWGLGLTPAQYRAQGTSGFGLAIAASATGGGMAKGHLRGVWVALTYTLPRCFWGTFVGRRSPTKVWFGG